MSKNPYSQAADAYGTTAAETDPCALEAKVLLKAAFKLEDLAARLRKEEKIPLEEIGDTLDYNQKLWQVFVDDAQNPDHPLPQEIKNNIASLALFVFKRTHEVLIDTKPEKLTILMNINRNIAAGLMQQSANRATQKSPAKPAEKTPSATDSLA